MQHSTEIIDRKELTPREAGVLRLICSGLCDKDIAQSLAISIRTVETHIERVYLKLGVQNERLNCRVSALRVALQRGIVRLSCLVLAVSFVAQADHAQVASRTARAGVVRVLSRRGE